MKKQIVILVVLSTISLWAYSQDTPKKLSFLFYSNFDLSSRYLYRGEGSTDGVSHRLYTREFNGFGFSPAVKIKNPRGNAHYLEISRLRYDNDYSEEYFYVDSTGVASPAIAGEDVRHFECYLRYEYSLGLFKRRNWEKLGLSLGFSACPFFNRNKTIPLLSSEYPITTTSTGVYLSVIPRIEYNINEKWFLDVNLPLALVTAEYMLTRIDNPAIEPNQRLNGIFDFRQGPIGVAVRLGLGFRL